MAFLDGASAKPQQVKSSDSVQVVEDSGAVSASERYRDVEKGRSSTTSKKTSPASSMSVDPRALTSLRKGDSEVEELAFKIEKQRENRIPVTEHVRISFLKTCRRIAKAQDMNPRSIIPKRCLEEMREEVQAEVDDRKEAEGCIRKLFHRMGFLDEKATTLKMLNRAMDHVSELEEDVFHYQDFSFYHTHLVSRFPFMRNSGSIAIMIMLSFYFLTPIWFCHIVPDENVCPSDTGLSYGGWLTALYFASTTMSTVGYGDVTVQKDSPVSVFIGIAYMVVALLVAVTAFSASAESAFSRFGNMNGRIISYLIGDRFNGSLLHQQIRKLKFIKLADICLQFVILNLVGFLLARFFVRDFVTDPEWTWMTTFYWAVQTTTTIGYGDLDMPFEFRWFQVIYLTLGTYFVGNAFGKLASLRQELEETRRFYAWKRRIVSKSLIMDMNLNDDILDQYEFVVSSLLSLGKIDSDDIGPIMDRFRTLAGRKGYIQLSDQQEEDDFDMEEDGDGCSLSDSSWTDGSNGEDDQGRADDSEDNGFGDAMMHVA